MSDLRKAAEMALNYFESAYELDSHEIEIRAELRQALAMERFSEVNQEIEEALAQPEQEPYGWISNEDGWFRKHEIADLSFKTEAMPLYTAPPKREWKCKNCGEIND